MNLCETYENRRANVTQHLKLLAIHKYMFRIARQYILHLQKICALSSDAFVAPVYISHENNCKRCKKKKQLR